MLDWALLVIQSLVTKEILVAVVIVISFNASYAIPERRFSIHLQEIIQYHKLITCDRTIYFSKTAPSPQRRAHPAKAVAPTTFLESQLSLVRAEAP